MRHSLKTDNQPNHPLLAWQSPINQNPPSQDFQSSLNSRIRFSRAGHRIRKPSTPKRAHRKTSSQPSFDFQDQPQPFKDKSFNTLTKRPPCRQNQSLFDLQDQILTVSFTKNFNGFMKPQPQAERPSYRSLRGTRPPSRHKTPPKAVGLELPQLVPEDISNKARSFTDSTPVKHSNRRDYKEIPLTLNSYQRRKSRGIVMKKSHRKRSIPNGPVLPFFSTLEPSFLGLFAN